jgi:hypothetical protein
MMNNKTNNLPILRPTPLTWLYVGLAIAVVVLTIVGLIHAGSP